MRTVSRVIAMVLVLAGCGSSAASSSAAQVRVHGSVGTTLGSTCTTADLAGSQVRITDTAGRVLAVADLPAEPVATSITVSGLAVPAEEFRYAVMVPADPRYGVSVGGLSPYYVGEAQFTGPGLDLTC